MASARGLSLSGLLFVGCIRNQEIPAERSYRALKAIEGATAVGVSKPRYDELLQGAFSEILMLRDIAAPEDSATYRRYLEALAIYKDAGSVWDEKINDAKYDWIPKGRIYVEGSVEGIARKYKLPQDTIRTSFGTKFVSISEESIPLIWEQATAAVSAADSVVVKKLRSR